MPLTYEQVGRALMDIAEKKSEWAGLPMPIEDLSLCLEPRFPYQFGHLNPKEEGPEVKVINSWFSRKLRCDVVVTENTAGKREAAYLPCGSGVTQLIDTIGASRGWLLEAEEKAMQKLASLTNDWKMRCYLLTGSFLESSKRSGVTYLFRRLRPTIAFRNDKVLCSLCLHPIGYYAGSYAGCMVPTDDVIAHLVMMRGDEEKFWANANQHPVWHPASALC